MTITVFLDRDAVDVDTGGMAKNWAITALVSALESLDPPSAEAADEGDDDEDD